MYYFIQNIITKSEVLLQLQEFHCEGPLHGNNVPC